MDSKTGSKNAQPLDLSQKWTNVLREANKSSVIWSCPRCTSRTVFATEDNFWEHIQDVHPEELPSGEDPGKAAAARKRLRAQATSQGDTKPAADDRSKPQRLSAARVPGSRREGGSLRQSQTLPPAAPLTTGQLKDFEQTHVNELGVLPQAPDHFDYAQKPPKKKAAIGSGKSPTSSVRTDGSNGTPVRRGSEARPASYMSPSKPNFSHHDARDRRGSPSQKQSRGPAPNKRLFEPSHTQPHPARLSQGSAPQPHSHPQSQSQPQPQQRPASGSGPKTIPISILSERPQLPHDAPAENPEELKIVRQPETRPISQEQLVAEVKGIYAGLVMVEGKCIQVDQKQAALAREAQPGTQLKLSNEQWQALIALHRTLLHEHHDFFLASQHPSATPAVRRLAIKYAMPARLWRHGIHSFLELLRNRLPDSLDHMLAFIYLAYSMMTLLYETVPAFEDTWIECLGDLGRYRMAIEDDDIRDREVWTQVARQWYLKASDKQPATGRLYHHLAILARPNALQQLFFYGKALSVAQPFVAARESVLTLFEPIMNQKQSRRFPPVTTAYVKLNAIIFLHKDTEEFAPTLDEYRSLLDGHIARVTQRWLEQGYYIAISNCIALLGFGSTDSVLVKALSDTKPEETGDVAMGGTIEDPLMFKESQLMFNETAHIVLQRVGDPNILSYLHVLMVFLVYISSFPNAMLLLEDGFPWEALVTMLNTLIRFYHTYERIEQDTRPIPDKMDFRPCPEEFAMRGLFWTLDYFSPGWFMNKNIEDENQYKEDASMNTEYRPEKILWLAIRLAKSGKYICYSEQEKRFALPSQTLDVPPEKDLDTRSDSATVIDDHDDDNLFASQNSSRKGTWDSATTDVEDSIWDGKTIRSEFDSNSTTGDRMDIEKGSLSAKIKTEDSPGYDQ